MVFKEHVIMTLIHLDLFIMVNIFFKNLPVTKEKSLFLLHLYEKIFYSMLFLVVKI